MVIAAGGRAGGPLERLPWPMAAGRTTSRETRPDRTRLRRGRAEGFENSRRWLLAPTMRTGRRTTTRAWPPCYSGGIKGSAVSLDLTVPVPGGNPTGQVFNPDASAFPVGGAGGQPGRSSSWTRTRSATASRRARSRPGTAAPRSSWRTARSGGARRQDPGGRGVQGAGPGHSAEGRARAVRRGRGQRHG